MKSDSKGAADHADAADKQTSRKDGKKTEPPRPWLVDVCLDGLR
jgi:hypothetical protein